MASKISSITENMFIKYTVDFIFTGHTQQTAYDLLAHGAQLALVLLLVAKVNQREKDIFHTRSFQRPSNVELIVTILSD